jgi:glycogen debranching enzyme
LSVAGRRQFAIWLDAPVLDQRRRDPVVDAVRERLLTPVGLRTLAPDQPDYKPRYCRDLRARRGVPSAPSRQPFRGPAPAARAGWGRPPS